MLKRTLQRQYKPSWEIVQIAKQRTDLDSLFDILKKLLPNIWRPRLNRNQTAGTTYKGSSIRSQVKTTVNIF